MRRYSDKMQRIRDFVDPLGDPRRVNSEIKWHGREIQSHWNQVCLSHVTCCCALTLHILSLFRFSGCEELKQLRKALSEVHDAAGLHRGIQRAHDALGA